MSEHSPIPESRHSAKKPNLFLESIHFRIALTLFAITGAVALLLGVVNGLTKDKIAAIAEEKAIAARTEVMPEAASFNDLSYSDDVVYSVYEARDTNGALLGFAIETGANGFGGPIQEIVGIEIGSENGSYQLRVSGVSILDMSDETPGVGSKANTSSFLGQFVGMTLGILTGDTDAASSATSDLSYDAVSGATYSSEGVRAGVEAALTIATQIIEESGGTVE